MRLQDKEVSKSKKQIMSLSMLANLKEMKTKICLKKNQRDQKETKET